MTQARSIEVTGADAGCRLDLVLARELAISRGYVRRLLELERILLEGRPPRKGTLLRRGDRLDVLEFRHPSLGPLPNPDLEVRILCEEAGLLAVEKPAGIPTHPLDYEERNTLLNGLLSRYPVLSGLGEGGLLAGVVHRLDVDTSGVQLFATEEAAWRRARRAFSERRVEKRYLARVHGRLASERTLRLRLENRGDHVRVGDDRGREAITRLAPLRAEADTSLLEVQPLTGLRHQIRASLAHIGHPVVGDALYGSTTRLPRHLLHAERIRIGDFAASSPPPPELEPAAHFSSPPSNARKAR